MTGKELYVSIQSPPTIPLAPHELAKRFKKIAPPHWTAKSFALVKGTPSDSVWFKRKAQPGVVGVMINLHLHTGEASIAPQLSKGYFYSFITAMQTAVTEWADMITPVLFGPVQITDAPMAVTYQRVDGVTYFQPAEFIHAIKNNAIPDDLL